MPQVLRTLSQRLLADIAEWQARLDEPGIEGRLKDAAFLAHRIRGTADVFGADKLSVAAARLEAAARTDRTEDIRSLMTKLRHELVSLEQSIRSGL